MLRKSLVCSFAITATIVHSAQNTSVDNSESNDEVIFPSKTYFMMAVDRHIAKNIKPVDLSRLLGVPGISESDEQTIYNGVRRVILKDAANKWDSGVASNYGRELGLVMGWQNEAAEPGYELQNRVMLFRYALQSQKAAAVLEHYDSALSSAVESVDYVESINQGDCEPLAKKSHYNFYEQLSALTEMNRQTLQLASRFESLSACQKCAVDSLLSSYGNDITPAVIANSMADAQKLSDPKAVFTLVANQ